MKILILEDAEERVRQFKQKFIEHDVKVSDKPKEIIQLLQDDSWDVLFLDHDLGDKIYVPSGEGTGFEVADWLAHNPDRIPSLVILHSLNYHGRQAMASKIPDAVHAPFCWVDEKFNMNG
jgi:hypothetical protein